MSLSEMQACLARLYVDGPFRRLFFVDPSVLDEYRLTPEEDAAIQGIDRTSLEMFAGSLKNKRLGRIKHAFPVLFALGSEDIIKYYSRYYELFTAKPNQSGQQDVLDFGVFIEDSLAGADHMPPYAAEVARYERLYYQVRFAPRFSRPQAPDGHQAPTHVTGDEAVAYLRDGVEIADFDYDIAKIEEHLHAGRPAPAVHDLTGSGGSVAFRPATRTSAVRMLRLNAPTKAVVDSCDGVRRVADIVRDVEAELGGADLRDNILKLLDQLLSLEILTLEPGLARQTDSVTHGCGMAQVEGL